MIGTPAGHLLPHRARRRRGLSLVELMVGIVVGLFVVAAASLLVSGQLAENRRLLLDTQLQQDLRATADIVSRDLRRIGAWGLSWNGIANAGAAAQDDPYNVTTAASNVATSDLTYSYERTGVPVLPTPWRLQLQNNVIRMKVDPGPAGLMQDLTDPNVMVVDTFTITRVPLTSVQIPCPKLCVDAAGNPGVACWPEQAVNEYVVDITAHARSDPTVVRSIRSRVRQRNDKIAFNVAGASPQACPN